MYIGQPHVWTVDIENPVEVEAAIHSILSQKVNTEAFLMKCLRCDRNDVMLEAHVRLARCIQYLYCNGPATNDQ